MSFWGSLTNTVTQIGAELLDVVYPPVCGVCGQKADSQDRLICQRCWDMISGFDRPYCSQCKSFIQKGISCSACGHDAIPIFSLGHYDTTLKAIIHDLKFHCLKPLAVQLGDKLADEITRASIVQQIDCVIPVPLHPSRYAERGFNQAEEIAEILSRKLSLSLRPNFLYMTRKTKQQARLSAGERARNVKGAFAVDDTDEFLQGNTVLVVDDVTTTGATLREVRRVLLSTGVKRVIAAVCATAV